MLLSRYVCRWSITLAVENGEKIRAVEELKLRRFGALNGLRFPAIAFVFISHVIVTTSVSADMTSYHGLQGHLHEASGAVSFFLMLSGFVLTYGYRRRLASPTMRSVGQFVLVRLARFYPLHVIMLWVISLFVLTNLTNLHGAATVAVNLLLIQTWIPSLSTGINSIDLNGPSWTLAAELISGILLPYVMWVVAKSGIARSRLLCLLIAAAIWGGLAVAATLSELSPHTLWFFWFFAPMRAADFFVGVFVAYALFGERGGAPHVGRSAWLRWTSLEIVAIAGIFASIAVHESFPALVRITVLPMPSVVLAMVVFSYDGGLISRMLSARVFQYFGDLSFAVYISHFVILTILARTALFGNVGVVGFGVAAFAVTLAVSVALHHSVENPLRRALIARIYAQGSKRQHGSVAGDSLDTNSDIAA